MKEKFTSLKPKFFFTDKDVGQINVIWDVFEVAPSICFWHMKRAIRKKMQNITQKQHVRFTDDELTSLMLMIRRHYCVHPYMDEFSDLLSLREQSILEFKTNFAPEKFKLLVQYFEETWYSANEFSLSCR